MGRLLVCMPYRSDLRGDYDKVKCDDCHVVVAVRAGSRDQAKLDSGEYEGCVCESCAGDRLVGLKRFRDGKCVRQW